MKRTVVTAPGKAVLSGEYAVLAGAPAVSMAVDRRARVSVSSLADGALNTVAAPGYASGEWRFETGPDSRVRWQDGLPPGGLPVIEAAWQRYPGDAPLSIVVDTRDFHDRASGRKLGLGSSAAATTALLTALSIHLRDLLPTWAECRDVHRALQGQRGSGVDVATSYQGGLLRYSMADETPRALGWPSALEYRLLWSGSPADTVAQLAKYAGRDPHEESSDSLAAAAAAVADAWPDADIDDLLRAIARYTEALRQFDVDHGLGIFDAGHGTLSARASAAGLVYKPCGAGGGDIGIVLGTDSAAIEAFCGQAATEGFSKLDIHLDRHGVRLMSGGER
jgi:phosphomevalonate kinase